MSTIICQSYLSFLFVVAIEVSERQSFDIGRIIVLEGLDDSVTTKHLRVRCRYSGLGWISSG